MRIDTAGTVKSTVTGGTVEKTKIFETTKTVVRTVTAITAVTCFNVWHLRQLLQLR